MECTDNKLLTLDGFKRKYALRNLVQKTKDSKYLDLISETSSDDIYSDIDTDDYFLDYDMG